MTPVVRRPPSQPPAASAASNGGTAPNRGGSALAVTAVIIGGLVVGLAVVYFVLPRWLTTPAAPAEAPATQTTPGGDVRTLVATLYYVSPDGSSLVPVTHEVPFAASPSDQARAILSAQLAAAPQGAFSAIPAGVTLRGVYLTTHGDAYVDLSHEIITGHPGGSLNESLTVFTIVNALTQNVREITAVQILVDGKQVDTLAGHIDLRQPLAAAPRWIQKGQ